LALRQRNPKRMNDARSIEHRWAELPNHLRQSRSSWLHMLEQLRHEGIEVTPEQVGVEGWLNGWLWLIPLAEALQERVESLLRINPVVSHATLRLTNSTTGKDLAWCEALKPSHFRVRLVRPAPTQRYGFEVETETVFEGDTPETADFLVGLAQRV
jgi:hypothetical protein